MGSTGETPLFQGSTVQFYQTGWLDRAPQLSALPGLAPATSPFEPSRPSSACPLSLSPGPPLARVWLPPLWSELLRLTGPGSPPSTVPAAASSSSCLHAPPGARRPGNVGHSQRTGPEAGAGLIGTESRPAPRSEAARTRAARQQGGSLDSVPGLGLPPARSPPALRAPAERGFLLPAEADGGDC